MHVNPESAEQEQVNSAATPVADKSPWTRYCENCNSPDAEEGYATRLCAECRKAHSRYPIHKQIKGAAILVGIVIVYSLTLVPERLRTYINFEKAKQLMEEHRFHSARVLLEPLLEKYDDNLKLRVAFMEAALRDGNQEAADSINRVLGNMYFEDRDLLAQAERVSAELSFLYIANDFNELLDAHPDDDVAQLHIVDSLLENNPEVVGLKTAKAVLNANLGNFSTCDTILLNLLKKYPGSVDISRIYASSLNAQERYQEADSIYSVILQHYPEDPEALEYVQAYHANKNATADSTHQIHL
ncbi:hypothetical protein [Chitinophaga sp. sic0106]|uniref:hypothetical protein n=1 Tax=Chitinophaga sp. sic0106 TaxID=2854785 RepID=UPI001C4403BE|nr:hypothetical protein [Chitinophaga sp. sic0106]MBV7528551.1 hypothetical protein [Chitinophaga sp. sic0106]